MPIQPPCWLGSQQFERDLISERVKSGLWPPLKKESVISPRTANAPYLTITLGTVDDSSNLELQVAIFARNRRSWDAMDENLATFEGQPNWKPGDGV